MAEVDLDKRFDIHVQAENKLAEIEKYECSIYCCHSTGCISLKSFMNFISSSGASSSLSMPVGKLP